MAEWARSPGAVPSATVRDGITYLHLFNNVSVGNIDAATLISMEMCINHAPLSQRTLFLSGGAVGIEGGQLWVG